MNFNIKKTVYKIIFKFDNITFKSNINRIDKIKKK